MKKKLLCLILALAMLLSLVACGGNNDTPDTPQDQTPPADTTEPADTPSDDGPAEFQPTSFDYNELYDGVFGDFLAQMELAKDPNNTASERLALMAAAEAKMLGNGAMSPEYTAGGNYAISRVVPGTQSSVKWGSDGDRLENIVCVTDYIKSEDVQALRDLRNENLGTGTYVEKAKAYLTEHGYEIGGNFNTLYSSDPTTWDVLATFQSINTEFGCHTVDGLLMYDVENTQQPALATGYEVSDDGLTYTFHIREGVKWVDSQGREVGEVQADDWVASMQHMIDGDGGQEELVNPVIVGAEAYSLGEETDFSKVGVKAVDKYTLEYTLVQPFSVFPTMMGYCGVFGPLCRSYYESQGGKFGAEFDPTAESYTYGKTPNNIAYCGPYLVTNWTEKNIIAMQANPAYWNADKVVSSAINVYFYSGDDPLQQYNMVKDGTLPGGGLNANAIEQAKVDGLFDDYHYQSSTQAVSYVGFYNLARRAYANYNDQTKMVSPQTHDSADSIDVNAGVVTSDIMDDAARTHAALNNANFRLAMNFARDRGSIFAQSKGEELKYASLRNSFVPGDFSQTEEDTTVTVDGKEYSFPAGTWYGEMLQAFMDAEGVPAKVWDPEVAGGSGDGFDGWYNPDAAKEFMQKAVEELAAQGIEVSKENPIQIDYPYAANNPTSTNQAKAYEQGVTAALGDWVKLNLIGADSSEDFNYTGYFPSEGEQMNFDLAFVSGWSPDYGDAACYLDTLLPDGAGYITASMGLW